MKKKKSFLINQIFLMVDSIIDNFKIILNINDNNIRKKKTLEYISFINNKKNEILKKNSNFYFNKSFETFEFFIVENLMSCSFEENIIIRNELKKSFLSLLTNNINNVKNLYN